MANMWDERYASDDYFYGKEPNDYLKAQAAQLAPRSKVLCLAEGEGRNAVYLATLGHEVTAMDNSTAGLAKTRQLATERGVQVRTVKANLRTYQIPTNQYQAIVAIFMHLPPDLQQQVFPQIAPALTPGGLFIGEFYRPEQLAYKTGGPPDEDLLYSPKLLAQWLPQLHFEQLEAVERNVVEGKGHTGLAATVQVRARKSSS